MRDITKLIIKHMRHIMKHIRNIIVHTRNIMLIRDLKGRKEQQ
jgi:hypothetical protein